MVAAPGGRPAPAGYPRQLVLRIVDVNGATVHEHAVPLAALGPHQNVTATMQLSATIEPMPPAMIIVGTMNIPPWGEGF